MQHKGWHSRHYLPHFDSADVTQFLTFRLADSLPAEALARLKAAGKPETMRLKMLDRGWGTCWLRDAWTVMPNHVHVLFTMMPHGTLGEIVGSWKRFTAREANRRLGRTGAFWQTEYWDRFIRNEAHFHAAEGYIDQNPVKAGLAVDACSWPYGSARLKS